MESLRNTLKTLFLYKNPSSIITELFPTDFKISRKGHSDRHIDKQWFISAFDEVSGHHYTKDQIISYYQMTISKWMTKADDRRHTYVNSSPSVFNVLLYFATEVLSEESGHPVCHYDSLLRWHDISMDLTEDIFTTAFFAAKDCVKLDKNGSRSFLWRDTIEHDNSVLNLICQKQMVDVHYHLYGSTFAFELNWLSIMNSPVHRQEEFKKLDKYLQSPNLFSQSEKIESLYMLVMKASAIRLCLYYWIVIGDQEDFTEVYNKTSEVLKSHEVLEMESKIQDLNSFIKTARQLFGKRISIINDPLNEKYAPKVWDYAIDKFITSCNGDNPYLILSGERGLMYRVFKLIYKEDKKFMDKCKPTLFYTYLLIKNQFRQQLVQLNSSIGFRNFQEYQNRKTFFISKNSALCNLVETSAIKSSLCSEMFSDPSYSNRFVEARVTPKSNPKNIENNITRIDESSGCKSNFGYIFHFIKKEDNNTNPDVARHNKLRKDVKKQAMAIYNLRKIPNIGQRIIGIDAASSEIACPPEVFAPAFRFLRFQSIGYSAFTEKGRIRVAELGITYHVGEDFIDLVCGLRSVEEAILFLSLTNGDRLGHALVLGTNVDCYYQKRSYRISMPLQCLFDNIVWLLVRGSRCRDFYKIRTDLELAFEKYRYIIWGDILSSKNDISNYTLNDFYQAWLLRGDDPFEYSANDNEPKNDYKQGEFSANALNYAKECIDARQNIKARRLFKAYHFSSKVKKAGNKYEEIVVTKDTISVIKELQSEMLTNVEQMRLAIESNPTSNLRIGEMEYYKDHPLLHFYNDGIEHEGCEDHTICLSINTDDKGVFATSQDREYAVMACALEKQYQHGLSKNAPRTIYNWIDHIREMGVEQSFIKRSNDVQHPPK